MATERLANLGYLALIKETTEGTALTPTTYLPLYKESLSTNLNLDEDNPIVGLKVEPFNQYMGNRTHEGSFTVLGEPNTAQYILDMLLAQGSVTGSGPYTHPYTVGNSKSYTVDIAKGQYVHRFFGVKADELTVDFDKNKMTLEPSVSARGSYISRGIATISTITITLDTNYDPAPNKGLAINDLVRIISATTGNVVLDTTVSSVNADGITVVLGASATSASIGDYLVIRPATAAYTLRTPFLWTRSEFRFGSTAVAALSATHTPIEDGSGRWKISFPFDQKGGTSRSGSFDPAALPRLQASAELDIKTFLDSPDRMNEFLGVRGRALVVRHFSETGYELRLTFNNCIVTENKTEMESGKLLYYEMTYKPTYSTTDGQLFDIKVINNVSSA